MSPTLKQYRTISLYFYLSSITKLKPSSLILQIINFIHKYNITKYNLFSCTYVRGRKEIYEEVIDSSE